MVLVGQGRLFFTTLFYKLFNLKEEESLWLQWLHLELQLYH
jgi:hypothetical protein